MAEKSILNIVKIGGNVIDDPVALEKFLVNFSGVPAPRILVHGGGKIATALAEKMGIEQKLIQGRRVTDAETLKIITMVYAGLINKSITARLNAFGAGAIGISGLDGRLLPAVKRTGSPIDFGFAGDVIESRIPVEKIKILLEQFLCLVVAPVTADDSGQLLNTNADSIAAALAGSLSSVYRVRLIYAFEKRGVLFNAEDNSSFIEVMTLEKYEGMKKSGLVHSGMIPKLDNAFSALNGGAERVLIGSSEQLNELIQYKYGTGTLIRK